MTAPDYVHGYTREEQQRLIDQAAYWRDLILRDLDYRAGDRVLEIGCGVGAVLGILGEAFEGLHLAGIDIERVQIDQARLYLDRLGHPEADLRVGDAAAMPWPDASFDHVFVIWVIEHLLDPSAVLREARRVLRPGGGITLTETDYTSMAISPPNPDYDHFLRAFVARFDRCGDARSGLRLGPLLEDAGFVDVVNEMIGFHAWKGGDAEKLCAHIDYLSGFIHPLLEETVEFGGESSAVVRAGYGALQAIKSHERGAFSHAFYRGTGRVPA